MKSFNAGYSSFSIWCSTAISFNNRTHDFRLSINNFPSCFNRPVFPLVIKRIFPHHHGSPLVSILFPPLQIFLSILECFCKFCLIRHTIMASGRVTAFRTIPWLLPAPRINLNPMLFHVRDKHLGVKLRLIIQDQKFQAIFFAPRNDLFIKNLFYHFCINGRMLKMLLQNKITFRIARSSFVLYEFRVIMYELNIYDFRSI